MKTLYSFEGIVQQGAQRGKDLGFPTANIALNQQIPEGIYASIITIDGKKHYAATFIGSAIQFGEKDYKAESYILDFSRNLYGKMITVELFEKIRDNQKFENEKALVAQMEKDVEEVRRYFNK